MKALACSFHFGISELLTSHIYPLRLLLEAEEAFCFNDIDSAKTLYEKAISSAKEHRFISEEALAYELAGHFYIETGRKVNSVEYFLKAHEKYHEWVSPSIIYVPMLRERTHSNTLLAFTKPLKGAIAKANSVYESTMSSMGSIST